MNELVYPPQKRRQFVIVAVLFALYTWIFARFHHEYGMVITSLAIFPVIAGSWFFGTGGGITVVLVSIASDVGSLFLLGHPLQELFEGSGYAIGNVILFFVAVVVGRMATILRERNDALRRLETLEGERQNRVRFLESLNETTREVLEASDQKTMLEILLKRMAELFGADDSYFSFWDSATGTTIPTAAYGSMSDVYPFIQFEPGTETLTASIMKAGVPLIVEDVDNSEYMSEKVAALFPSRSMLGLPLIAQKHRSGALLLGYNKRRGFDQFEYARAQIVAQHIGLVLTKIQLLEDARKQLKQLTVLHEVALVTTVAETEDWLIERVTDIIGQNLFPDNFGILLLDENSRILRAHPSYRFFSDDEVHAMEVPLGRGVTGRVAETGQPQRIGNVNRIKNYLNVDERTRSELCVPIKHQERVLGVINAESAQRNVFTDDDERLLATLAGQLATAIEQLRAADAERQWLDQLARSNDLIYSLAHITTHIEKALDADGIIRTLGEELKKIGLTCILAIHHEERKSFTVNYASLEIDTLDQFENLTGFPLLKHRFSIHRLKTVADLDHLSQPTVIANPEDEIRILFHRRQKVDAVNILRDAAIDSDTELLRLPLMFEEQLLGILWVWGKTITRTDLPIMSIFAKQIGISLERARLFQEVQSLALTDPLTGLNNRRNLFELGRIEFARAHRMNRPFCCMMLDLDHFKQVNDNYGHQAGDVVLREFANRCKRSVREIDLIGRYGGEELITLMPETDLQTALHVAERLRKSIAETPVKIVDRELRLTVSIGVAQKDENTLELETLIARADQAMYIAKHKGRNRVAVSK